MPDTPGLRIDGVAAHTLPADDRGLAYGDGIFRTLAVAAGRPVAWAFQYQRLAHDCAVLAITCPSEKWLGDELAALIGDGATGVAKITLTRGSGGRGYTPPDPATPRVVVSFNDHRPAVPCVLTLDYAAIRLAEQPYFAGIKHLNRLEQVWARRECAMSDTPDLVMQDTSDRIIATTMRNLLFMDAEDVWYTPALSRCGIAGATRARLLHSAERERVSTVEADIRTGDLSRFVAAIACNSLSGAVPVLRIGACVFGQSPAMAQRARRWLAETA